MSADISPHIPILIALLLIHHAVDGMKIRALDIQSNTISSPTLINTHSTSPSHYQIRLVKVRHISVGIIVGIALGSAILASLCLMLLAKCRRRVRKGRKQPRGSVYFRQSSEIEMAQTQPLVLTPSAVPVVQRPVPMHFVGMQPSNNAPASLSPLITPTPPFYNTRDHNTAREFDIRSVTPNTGPLRSPYVTQLPSFPTVSWSEGGVVRGPSLQSNITEFQSAGHKSDQNQSVISDPPSRTQD